jgi:hypothetical protein
MLTRDRHPSYHNFLTIIQQQPVKMLETRSLSGALKDRDLMAAEGVLNHESSIRLCKRVEAREKHSLSSRVPQTMDVCPNVFQNSSTGVL